MFAQFIEINEWLVTWIRDFRQANWPQPSQKTDVSYFGALATLGVPQGPHLGVFLGASVHSLRETLAQKNSTGSTSYTVQLQVQYQITNIFVDNITQLCSLYVRMYIYIYRYMLYIYIYILLYMVYIYIFKLYTINIL